MKSIRYLGALLAICTMFAASPAVAQFGSAYTFPLSAGDTLNNVDSVFKGFKTTAGYKDLGVWVGVNKVSGTIAGKLILLGSMDGHNYIPVDSMSYVAVQTNSAITPTVTNEATLRETGTPYTNYIVMATGTGTMEGVVTVSFTTRRQQVSITP